MSKCEGCAYHYFKGIATFYENSSKALQFFRDHGVLPSVVKCPTCHKDCNYRDSQRIWRCTGSYVIPKKKKRWRCDFSTSDNKGTFLQNVSVAPWKVLVFVNHWISHHWDHKTVTKGLGLSLVTSVDWRSFCSEVAENWLSNQNTIGGPGIVVEIDETLIVCRKYERGRVLSQLWLFGGIERVSKKKFVVPLVGPLGEAGHRDKGTLIPIIQQYILPDSVIISDQWGAYKTLKNLGYTHYSINHCENFVDVADSNIHTQNIERLWRDVKEWVKRPGIKSKYLFQYLARYLFLTSHEEESRLHHFLIQAARLYPPQGTLQQQPVTLEEGPDDE